MTSRRNFIVRAPLTAAGLAIAGSLSFEGCAAGDSVVELLQLLQPGVDGILPIVGLADPALMPAVQIVINIFDGGVATAITLYKNYEAGVAANGGTTPTLLQEFESGMSSLNTDILAILRAAQVKNPAHETLISDIVSAISTEIGTIIGIYSPTMATSNPSARVTVTVFAPPSKQHLQAEKVAFQSRMYAILNRQTGDAALDKETAALAAAYK
jgi:hypothetical protein